MQKQAAKVINEDYFNPVLLVKDTLHWKLCTKSPEPLSSLHSRLFSLFSFCCAGYIRVRSLEAKIINVYNDCFI